MMKSRSTIGSREGRIVDFLEGFTRIAILTTRRATLIRLVSYGNETFERLETSFAKIISA